MILSQASTEGIIDVPAVVTKMREQRMKMVQTTVSNFKFNFLPHKIQCSVARFLLLFQDQYMLIHDAVLEFLICGKTRIMASGFSTAMDNLNKINRQTGKSGYVTQFEVSLSLEN